MPHRVTWGDFEGKTAQDQPTQTQVLVLMMEVAGIEPADGQIRTHDAETGFGMIPGQFVIVRYESSPFAPFMPHQKITLYIRR